jgi:hypothetical protein
MREMLGFTVEALGPGSRYYNLPQKKIEEL